MKLSHSAKDKYLSCSEKYRLHYIKKLRSPKIFSALFFGSALDDAFSALLVQKKSHQVDISDYEFMLRTTTPEQLFMKKMEQVEHNGKVIEVAKSPFADYYTSDFEPSLLTDEALEKLYWFAPDVVDVRKDEAPFRIYARANILAFMEACKSALKAKKKLSTEDLTLFNYVTWLTLVEKGLLMIEAYRTQIMPQIFEVYSIQESISLPNEAGDEVTGLIDFTCSFVDDPGTMYVCDNKTSSKPYKASQTGESPQLATYCEYKGTNKAAYVVIEKKIYAKEPKIHTQILRDTIAEEVFSLTFAQFENVLHNVCTSNFEKNFKACFEFGRMCPYFSLCKYGKTDGLVDMSPAPVKEEDEAEV